MGVLRTYWDAHHRGRHHRARGPVRGSTHLPYNGGTPKNWGCDRNCPDKGKCDGTEGGPNLVGRPMSDDRFPLIYRVMGGVIIALYVALGLLMVPELLPGSTLTSLLNGSGAP